MQQVIGIDLGGTAIKLGRFTTTGECLQSLSVPTPQPQYPKPVLTAVAKAVATLDPHYQATAIGIGTPGPADITARIARIAINLPGWLDIPVAAILEAQTQRPVVVANDANCAGLGETWLGAGQAYQNLILLTLGTGVGGCIILNGQLFVGHDGCAGELGLVTLDPNGHECHSGNTGSLEQHVSAQAIRREMGMEPGELATLAAQGDKHAIAFWQRYGRLLGIGLVSSIYVLNPEAVIIGGGISAAARHFLPATQAEISQRIRPHYRGPLQILTATLGNRAGMIGAAKIALDHIS
ncbi:rok family protein [Leptolyngbya sp. Heron Island J]|uniref:ROK family protein n=1 Tax=Leptolyngbya sp. Heron Island J TaxID=1385935 RepID=UPI0003B9A07F|nr:ROK family protein [Leptolyngbya sp. Heron Island J]ESA37540.1 rok family protein [Leptolyngbya sp. Heron Island J]